MPATPELGSNSGLLRLLEEQSVLRRDEKQNNENSSTLELNSVTLITTPVTSVVSSRSFTRSPE